VENKGFGDPLIEIKDGEMPSEIFENRKCGVTCGAYRTTLPISALGRSRAGPQSASLDMGVLWAIHGLRRFSLASSY
jgi:hypothetical protein